MIHGTEKYSIPRALESSVTSIVVVTVAYAVIARISFLITIPPGNISPIFPSAGIALAAVLILGRRVLPGVWLGSFLANYSFYVGLGTPTIHSALRDFGVCSSIAIGAMASAGIGAYLVASFCRGHHPIYSGRNVLILVTVGALGSYTISATIGVASMSAGGYVPWEWFGYSWLTWWVGDAAGTIVAAPLILAWHLRHPFPKSRWRALEGAALAGVTLIISFLDFFNNLPFVYVLIPVLSWAAFRFGIRGASTTAAAIALFATIFTSQGKGPFLADTLTLSLILLHSFLGVSLIFALFLAGVLAERERAQQALRRANDRLELRVTERTALAEHRAAQLRKLVFQLAHSEQHERERIGRLLHDNLQQILVAAKLQLGVLRARTNEKGALESITRVDEHLTESLDSLRTLSSELYPAVLHEAGLGPALEWLARHTRNKYGLDVSTHINANVESDSEGVVGIVFEAVRELLFNVVKHSGAPTAHIDLNRLRGFIHVVVSDDGVGFNQATLSSDDGKDTHLGLLNIRERMQYIGGCIDVDSAPGHGTRVTLVVRVHEPTVIPERRQPAHLRRALSALPEWPAHDKTRILLVDDHAIIRQGIKAALSEQVDIDVVAEASNGEQAFEQAHTHKPDVIIMDISMPIMNGIDATRRILAELPESQVIALSMFAQEDRADAMFKAGAVEYVTKDGPLEDLVAAIRRCAARSPTASGSG